MFKDKIIHKKPGILTYGMTPPKATNQPEQLAEISHKQIERLHALDIDALLLYDVQEEAERIEQERPFPYLPTVDPSVYSETYLQPLKMPHIIYRCVGNYTEAQFLDWLQADTAQDTYSVYVGASSSKQKVELDLTSAYRLSKRHNSHCSFGGVVIPERHMQKKDEHIRIFNKINSGCEFFITQATFNVEASKNMLSDLYHYCTNQGLEMVPILFNLAPCGSVKTLEFMKWLGISIPVWLENEIKYSNDVLGKSIQLAQRLFEELLEFGLEKGIPIGCSIESVSTRKSEIEASIQLAKDIKSMLDNKLKAIAV